MIVAPIVSFGLMSHRSWFLERSGAEPKHENCGTLGSAQSLSIPVSALKPSRSRAELSGGNTTTDGPVSLPAKKTEFNQLVC